MVLPIDAATIRTATPPEHAGWHAEMHSRLAESPSQPNTITVDMLGHRQAHDAVAGEVRGGHPTGIDQNDPLHLDWHRWIHFFLDPPTTGATISSGGTYTGGVYGTTDHNTPAITIATADPVVIEKAMIAHHGFGVFSQGTQNVKVELKDCVVWRRDPGSVQYGEHVYAFMPNVYRLTNCRFINGNATSFDGGNTLSELLEVRFCDFLDLGRYGSPNLTGAVHWNHVEMPGARIHWNRVRNRRGFSLCEDCIGLTDTNGGAGNPIDVAYNLLDGMYPLTGDGADFTGGAIDLGDLDGSYQDSHHNTVVRCTNNGYMIPAGQHLFHHHNRAVTSGLADDGNRCSSTFGSGVTIWDNPDPEYPPIVDCKTHSNLVANGHGVAHRRWNGTAWERNAFIDYYLPDDEPTDSSFDNDSISIGLTDEPAWEEAILDAIAAWEAERAAAGVVIGPRSLL